MKIRIINPTYRNDRNDRALEVYKSFASPSTDLSIVSLNQGPESIESYYDVSLAVPNILVEVRLAATQGIDAIILDCMADPGLFAAREVSDIPVIGSAQSAMNLASCLANRFSVIAMLSRMRNMFQDLWKLYDLTNRAASVRAIEIPVTNLRDDDGILVNALAEQAKLAVNIDGAQAIVFGCTGMSGLAKLVQNELVAAGIHGVPVIDPTGVSLKVAESLGTLGLSHSKISFPQAPNRKTKGY